MVRVVTSDLVAAETHALLLRRAGRSPALAFVREVARAPTVVVSSSPDLEQRAVTEWLERYHDQDFSYTDAVSFAIMAERGDSRSVDHRSPLCGGGIRDGTRRPVGSLLCQNPPPARRGLRNRTTNAGTTHRAPMVPATVPPAVASAMAPNSSSGLVPTASGRRLASVVSVTSRIIPVRSLAADDAARNSTRLHTKHGRAVRTTASESAAARRSPRSPPYARSAPTARRPPSPPSTCRPGCGFPRRPR